MKTGKDIRQDFISFFEDKGHKFVRSSPVAPIVDPSLLFTNVAVRWGVIVRVLERLAGAG